MILWLKQSSHTNETINVTLFQNSTMNFCFKRELSTLCIPMVPLTKVCKLCWNTKLICLKASDSSQNNKKRGPNNQRRGNLRIKLIFCNWLVLVYIWRFWAWASGCNSIVPLRRKLLLEDREIHPAHAIFRYLNGKKKGTKSMISLRFQTFTEFWSRLEWEPKDLCWKPLK